MHTGFLLEPVSEEVKESFPATIKLSFLTSGHQKRTIQCFDVNEDGMIAIGCERLSKKYVGVYTNDGHFQYGYEFECSSSFGVEWDGDDLIIYFVRSDIALAVNSSGEVVGIGKIPNTFASNSYWHNSVFLTRRTVGDTQYVIKNDMGPLNLVASSYSQLVMISPDGTENILYDVNTDHMIAVSLVLSGIIVFVSICGISIWRAWKKTSIIKKK